MNGFIKYTNLILLSKFLVEWKYSRILFRQKDPMKLGIMNLFINIFNSFFGVKFKAFLNNPILTNRNSSSRDNSIIIIKVLIGIIVYDLDVELNILICAVAF